MSRHDIIVIGASAGGVEALTKLMGALPADLPAAIFIAVHVPAYSVSLLPDILRRKGPFPAAHAQDGEAIQPRRIYAAPPDYHLLIEPGTVHLSRGPKENHTRPAIDPLFRTAAQAYGPRVVGVILSGTLDDGTAGLLAIKRRGGVTIAQDPAEALFPDMPRHAVDHGAADYILPLSEIASLLAGLSQGSPRNAATRFRTGGGKTMARVTEPINDLSRASALVEQTRAAQFQGGRNGEPSIYSCPDCGGVMWEMDEGDLIRFRCHVGHIFSAEVLLREQSEALEAALWYAIRTLVDKVQLSKQLAAKARKRGHELSAVRFDEQAAISEQHARMMRQVVEGGGALSVAETNDTEISDIEISDIETTV